MAMRELKRLQEDAAKLTADEQLQLAEFLIERARSQKRGDKKVDLNAFAGKVKLKEDPMEYQRRVRAEWP